MAFADLVFYKIEFLNGDTQTIPDNSFDRRATEASAEINRVTFGRAKTFEEIPTEIKHCACELAELFYSEAVARSNNAVKSKSLDGWSKTMEDQRRQPEDFEMTKNAILDKWLDALDVDGVNVRYSGV